VDSFVARTLNLPRDDRPHKSGCPPFLIIDGHQCTDPQTWKRAFVEMYTGLFTDPSNDLDAQNERLRDLRAASDASAPVFVPLWLLREVVQKSKVKTSSAPGTDGITWKMIAALPESMLALLRDIFQKRINNEAGFEAPVAAWAKVFVRLIPKVNGAVDLASWRPIAVTQVLQKLFLATCSRLLADHSRPVSAGQLGFQAGRQTMEVSEAIRVSFQKAKEWGLDMTVLKLDVHRAFDSMSHELIAGALNDAQCPPRLVHSFLRELYDTTLDLHFSDFVWGPISYSRGGRQGGAETPELWCRFLDRAIVKAVQIWKDRGLGLRFPDVPHLDWPGFYHPFIGWADDLFVCGSSESECFMMWEVLSKCIFELGLSWKPSSLQLLSNQNLPLQDLSWNCEGRCFKISRVDHLVVLGTYVDAAGTDLAAIKYRIREATRHFASREGVFCCRKVPLHLRWARLRQTVLATFLFSCGGWRLNEASESIISGFESNLLRRTLCRQKRDDESPGDFLHRLNSRVVFLKSALGWRNLVDVVKCYHLGWMGHVARISGESYVRDAYLWRSPHEVAKVHWRMRPCRFKPGKPFSVEDSVIAHIGPDWTNFAQNRALWSRLKTHALRSWGVHQPCPVRNYSTKILASIGHKRHPYSVRLLFLIPSETICLAVLGLKSLVLSSHATTRQALTLIRWHLHLLEMVGFRPAVNSVFLHHQSLSRLQNMCDNVSGFDAIDYGKVVQPGSLLVIRCCPTETGNAGMMHLTLHNPDAERQVLGAKYCLLDDSVHIDSVANSDFIVNKDTINFLESLLFALQSFWEIVAGYALME
jgi:hypothetical protein